MQLPLFASFALFAVFLCSSVPLCEASSESLIKRRRVQGSPSLPRRPNLGHEWETEQSRLIVRQGDQLRGNAVHFFLRS